MDALILILIVIGMFSAIISLYNYFSSVLSGSTTAIIAGQSAQQVVTIKDLGDLRLVFTNYSPWRIRFGAILLIIGATCSGIGLIGDRKGLQALAGFLLIVGIIVMLYMAFLRIDTLELYVHGFVLREGKSKSKAAYYSDIFDISYRTITYTTNGVEGTPIAKSLLISLHSGGGFEVSTSFVRFDEIEEEIKASKALCAIFYGPNTSKEL